MFDGKDGVTSSILVIGSERQKHPAVLRGVLCVVVSDLRTSVCNILQREVRGGLKRAPPRPRRRVAVYCPRRRFSSVALWCEVMCTIFVRKERLIRPGSLNSRAQRFMRRRASLALRTRSIPTQSPSHSR